MIRQRMMGMRVIAVAAAFLMVAGNVRALEPLQQKDDLFAGAEKFSQGAKSTTEVNLDKNMLGMVGEVAH